eukprot:NODE_24017_length_642_cov_1.234951.p3 GENE.NODE_24017_length_642_cov_1.234951~~NODE_24017_length_642_cov_1.234951.p3  ORF type:complete len:54 (-),score=0.18 NODE_24017_length_642_cov_1.234951:19-180(-)
MSLSYTPPPPPEPALDLLCGLLLKKKKKIQSILTFKHNFYTYLHHNYTITDSS